MTQHSAKPAWTTIPLFLFYLIFGFYLFFFWMAALILGVLATAWAVIIFVHPAAMYYMASMILVGFVCLIQYARGCRIVELQWACIVLPVLGDALFLLLLPSILLTSMLGGDIILYTAILLPPLAAIWQIALAKRAA